MVMPFPTSSIVAGKGRSIVLSPIRLAITAVDFPPPPIVISRLGRVFKALSKLPRLPGKRRPSRHSELSAESRDRRLTLATCSGRASSNRYSSVHMLSDAARTALAAKSDAKPAMDAPSFGAIAEHVLVAVVEGVGDAQMRFDPIVQPIGEAGAGQPIGIEPDQLGRKDVEIAVGSLARVGD